MKKNKGFSLIELLVVISIIGILTTVLVMNFMGTRERARDAQKIQNLNSIKNALRMYYNDYQSYPASLSTIVGSGGYIADLGETGSYFVYTSTTDGFVIRIGLESGAGNEDINSQTNCGIGQTNKIYAVCAK